MNSSQVPGEAPEAPDAELPVMPGFREMAQRRMADEQAARMAARRGRLIRELAERRQATGLSQTEVAARMGTSQSAVARLESGTGDVRASTLERYAAAVGRRITWKLDRSVPAGARASGEPLRGRSVLSGARASGEPPRGRSVLSGARASGEPPRGRSGEGASG